MTKEDWIPGSMPELLASIEHEWKLLMDVVAQLDEVKMTTPDAGGWSPKDNLAHLAEWIKILMGYHMDRRPSYEGDSMRSFLKKLAGFPEPEGFMNKPIDEKELLRMVSDLLNK